MKYCLIHSLKNMEYRLIHSLSRDYILLYSLIYSSILFYTLIYSYILLYTLIYSCILLYTLIYSYTCRNLQKDRKVMRHKFRWIVRLHLFGLGPYRYVSKVSLSKRPGSWPNQWKMLIVALLNGWTVQRTCLKDVVLKKCSECSTWFPVDSNDWSHPSIH